MMDMQVGLFVVGVLVAAVGGLITILLGLILGQISDLRKDIAAALQANAVLKTIVDALPCRTGKGCSVT